MVVRVIALCLLLASVSAAASAQEECPAPPRAPLETTPISGSTGVAVNAFVRARYPAGHLARYAERIRLFAIRDDALEEVDGTLEVASDDTLFFIPSEELEPGLHYVAEVSGVDRSIEAQFRVGPARDVEPPTRPFILDVEAGVAAPTCALPKGGVRLSVLFRASNDDGGVASVQYALYRTRGVGVEAPTLVARAAQTVFPGETQSIGVVLTEREASGTSCFVLVAEDGLLRTSSSEEFCVAPSVGIDFDSLCAVSDVRDLARGLAPALFVVLAIAARARRRTTA